MNEAALLRQFASLRRASGRGGDAGARAPHKPLLLLCVLRALEQEPGHPNRFSFAEVKGAFNALWERFGWTAPTRAALPFWHLASSELWTLVGTNGTVNVSGMKPPSDQKLAATVEYGALSDSAWNVLRDSRARQNAMEFLVTRFFPESVHDELRLTLGLPAEPITIVAGDPETPERRRRSAADQARFRDVVLVAYEGRCAVCDFRPQNARAPSAIVAAHIWPFEYGGPFDLENGVALCPMHHWALDSGTMGIADDLTILVSSLVFDGPVLESFLRSYSGKALRAPRDQSPPARKFVELHRLNLFLGNPIPAQGRARPTNTAV